MQTTRRPARLRVAIVARRRDAMLVDLTRHMLRALARLPRCVVAKFDSTNLAQAIDWQPDAMLAHVNTQALIAPLSELTIPVVNTSGIYTDLPFPTVQADNVQVGRLAAQHLLAKGFRQFAFIGPAEFGYAVDRKRGFVETLGIAPDTLPHYTRHIRIDRSRATITPDQRHLAGWLDGLPPNTGLCITDDRLGAGLIECLGRVGVDPLERFGIITCHDRYAPCFPALSGVQIPEDRWAATAVQVLIDLVNGQDIDEADIRIPPIGVVERATTARLVIDDPILRQAMQFITDHAAEPIAVTDVAAAVHMGRRAVERRFARELGRTILDEIHRAHLERAKTLLIETDRAIHTIATDAGLSSDKALRRLFDQHLGVSPSAFRDQYRIK